MTKTSTEKKRKQNPTHPEITIINQQYPPEPASTGQIFCAIAENFARHGWRTTVVTGDPYYPGMTEKPPRRETRNGVSVRRLWNTKFPKSSLAGKLFNLITFELSLFFYCLFRIGRNETVLVGTAPPLAVFCAALGKKLRGYRVYLTVQDLYPDVLKSSGMSDGTGFTYRFLHRVMGRSMRRCDAVASLSREMCAHLQKEYGLPEVRLIPNFFPEAIEPLPRGEAKAARGWGGKLVVQYSGNFGVAHEYQTLLGAARLLRNEPVLFQITGAGSNYFKLKAACEQEGLSNVVFEGYAPASELERHLSTADLSVVIFSAAFQNVLLPSKYYGILASGRGTLLISSCESDIARDIDAERVGLRFREGESERIAEALRALLADDSPLDEMGARARALYQARYAREAVIEQYRAWID